MAQVDLTQAAVFIPELWAPQPIRARERAMIMPKRIKRLDFVVAKGGDTIHVPVISNLSANDVTLATGAFSAQAPLEVEVQVSINKWKESSVDVLNIVDSQNSYDLLAEYGSKQGYALALQTDTDCFGLYSGVTNQIGTSGADINDDTLLNAVQLLDESDVPEEDRSAAYRPAQKRALLKIDKFFSASMRGDNKESPLLSGSFSKAVGINHFFSNTVVSSSGKHNLVWHKDAFCIALQQDVKMDKKDPSTTLSKIVVAHTLYGVKTLRADHAIDVLS